MRKQQSEQAIGDRIMAAWNKLTPEEQDKQRAEWKKEFGIEERR